MQRIGNRLPQRTAADRNPARRPRIPSTRLWYRDAAATLGVNVVVLRDQVCAPPVQSLPMSHAAVSDQEQHKRRVRLMIIIGLAAAVVLGGLVVSIIGSRQVTAKVDDLRQAASTATVDPELVALTAYGTDSDPVSEALGSDRVVSLQQQTDNRWCVETQVSALLSSQTVFFVINEGGHFIETPDCLR